MISGIGRARAAASSAGRSALVLAEQRQDALQRKAALGGAEQAPVVGDGMPAGGDAGFGEVGDDVGGEARAMVRTSASAVPQESSSSPGPSAPAPMTAAW